MTLKEFVIAHVKPEDYYQKRFPTWNPKVRSNVSCPFHSDGGRPNLAICLRGGGARCHSSLCGKSIGNIVHFESERFGIKEKIAARNLYREFIRKVVSAKRLEAYRNNLITDPNYVYRIRREMGLDYKSIKRFQLGLDPETNRITIPVYDIFNQCVNVRFYRLPSQRKVNEIKIYNLDGYGGSDIFLVNETANHTPDEPLYIMASEKEAMLATQDGYAAYSSTTGEGAWSEEWDRVTKGRDVCLVFDTDKAGFAATQSVKPHLAKVAKSVRTIILSFRIKRPDRKDYADWRLKDKHPAHELKLLSRLFKPIVTFAPSLLVNKPAVQKALVEYPELPPFKSEEPYDIAAISSQSQLLNHRIKTQGIVAAKSPNTYSIPWKFQVQFKNKPDLIYAVALGRELLRFIRSSDTAILQSVQRLVGTASCEVTPISYLTATEIEVIPTAVIDKDIPYVVQRCYYFGERIEANVPYYLEIIPTSEIRTQETIGIITHISPLSKSIDRFDLTPENIADLSIFQPTEGEDVWEKLESVANEVTHRFTKVYNRLDWTLAAILTWTSPIGFRFPNDPDLQRGWLNTLALGDTETGKSKVSKALRNLFKAGVFVNGENCTFVGLVGGAIKMGSGQLMLRWGRIPLSDKQLVVLEELSGLSVDEIANMSDVRSSGMARLDKGGINSETNSRTRLLCLSNARSSKKSLSNYLFGVHAIQELIGHGEDIARFDLITTLTDREVSIDVINANRFAPVAKPKDEWIAEDQFQKLIHFIWALKPDQIKFSQEAYEECLTQTKKLSVMYHPSIPIFKGGSGRYKLGRIAASIACFQFAYDSSESIIQVSRAHVVAATTLLQLIYNKPSFGYLEFSQQMFDREKVKDEALLRKSLKTKIARTTLPKAIEAMIHSTRFNRDELCAISSISIQSADQLIGVMLRERALRKGEMNLWEITPAGKLFLETFLRKLKP